MSGWSASMPRSGSTFRVVSGADPSRPHTGERLELADARRLARRAVRGLVRTARDGDQPDLSELLLRHFAGAVEEAVVVEETWPGYEHVNVQAGLDAWLAQDGRAHELVGITKFQNYEFGLGELLTGSIESFGPRPGPVARVNVGSGPAGAVTACVQCGLYLVEDGEHRAALLLRGPDTEGMQPRVSIHVASSDVGHAAQVAGAVRALAVEHNVFRGQVLSFGGEVFDSAASIMQFHQRPSVADDRLILPVDVRESVRRQVVGLARHRDRLLAAGQHLKRGLLLYGPPGVGKTHTVRWLLGQLTGVTVVQVTGTALNLIGEACSVARSLQPAVVVVEDVDLIAEDRGEYPGEQPLLFQLLDEMDGLAEDADVVFVLTTNRPDVLEPALAARPGRVDQAVELALPDEDARRALFELYSRDVDVDTSRLDEVLTRTEGVTASFLKELLRRACVVSADREPDDQDLRVSADDLDEALDELLDSRNAMTRVLLGGGTPDPTDPFEDDDA